MKTKILLRAIVVLIVILVNVSCKKENSCEGCKEINQPPIAIAGPDQVITLPTDSVSLDGSASNDPDGRISVWLWKKISGPASFDITNSSSQKTVVKNLEKGVYQIELKVTDDKNSSITDTVQIIVNDPEVDIYVSGSLDISNGVSYDYIPALWKNGIVQNLPAEGHQGFARSVYVSGSDVYVVGWDAAKAKLWKNGVALNLTNGLFVSSANSVYVSGSDVYVAGYDGKIAMLWKNGVAQNLTDGSFTASANSVYVLGTDVYVVGTQDEGAAYQEIDDNGTVHNLRKSVAWLWKNGVSQNLTDGSHHASANSVYVSGSDVYVAGYELNSIGLGKVRLWKNGVAQILESPSDTLLGTWASSVYVAGSDVYVVGSEGKNNTRNAKLWKNGVGQDLSSGPNWQWATSVFVSGNDVYVVGYGIGDGINSVKLWKNGVVQNLAGISEAFSVFVVEK